MVELSSFQTLKTIYDSFFLARSHCWLPRSEGKAMKSHFPVFS